MKQSKQRILVVRRGHIGDTVVSLPALRAIRRHFGAEAEIWLLQETVPDFDAKPEDVLIKGKEVDQFVSYVFRRSLAKKIFFLIVLFLRLWRLHFNHVVCLSFSKDTHSYIQLSKFFFRLCGIPRLIGFYSDPASIKHEALFMLECISKDGIDISVEKDCSCPLLFLEKKQKSVAKTWLNTHRRYKGRPLVAICPGTNKPANAWPIERFIEIGRRLINLESFELIICGGRKEQDAGNRMVEAWKEGLNAAGIFSVLGSAALLSECRFMIGLDTGTTHLGAACGIPCIDIYGGRSSALCWEPLGSRHIIVSNFVPCANCMLKKCNVKGHPCMTGITVDMVWQAVLQMEECILNSAYA